MRTSSSSSTIRTVGGRTGKSLFAISRAVRITRGTPDEAATFPFAAPRSGRKSRLGLDRSLCDLLDRHRKVNLQAFGLPVVGKSAAKLAADNPVGEQTTETLVLRFPVNRRSTMFRPCEGK